MIEVIGDVLSSLKIAFSVFGEQLKMRRSTQSKYTYVTAISVSFSSDEKGAVIAAKNFFHQRIGEAHDEAKEKYL
jgi:hypothetical protein